MIHGSIGSGGASSRDEVVGKNCQSHEEQEVNQVAGDIGQEANKSDHQNDSENCPENPDHNHFSLFSSSLEISLQLDSLAKAGLSRMSGQR